MGAGGADTLVDAASRGGPRTAFGALRAARALLTGAAPASRSEAEPQKGRLIMTRILNFFGLSLPHPPEKP